MAKDGKAKVLDDNEFASLIACVREHRHPSKNVLIFMISFKLGLRVQEIALLRLREVIEIGPKFPKGYKLKSILILPKSFTKGARAMAGKGRKPVRTSVRFTIREFDTMLERVEKDVKAGLEIEAERYYPEVKQRGGKTRELPLVSKELLMAIEDHIDERIDGGEVLRPESPLILSQKGHLKAYTPNSLQDHMRKMQRIWTGIERASSHSGRRTLATTLLHSKGESLKAVQQILGHQNPSTTLIYQELPEGEIASVLKRLDDGEIDG